MGGRFAPESAGAFFLTGFARHDRYVVLGDFSYSSLSKSGRLPTGVPAAPSLT